MFFELLYNSNEKIFLEAIDQRYNIEKNKEKNEENKEELNFEENIKKLNFDFCESLDSLSLDKDNSTEEDSDNISLDSNNKKFILMNDIIKKESIKKNKEYRLNYFINQIEFIDKTKTPFISNLIKNSNVNDK